MQVLTRMHTPHLCCCRGLPASWQISLREGVRLGIRGIFIGRASAPDVPLDVALPVLVAAPGVDGPPVVQRQAVPPAGRRLHHARAAQRRDPPRLALVAPGQGQQQARDSAPSVKETQSPGIAICRPRTVPTAWASLSLMGAAGGGWPP